MRAVHDMRTVGLNHSSRCSARNMHAMRDMCTARDDGCVTCVQFVTYVQCVTCMWRVSCVLRVTCVQHMTCVLWDYPTTLLSNRFKTSSDYGYMMASYGCVTCVTWGYTPITGVQPNVRNAWHVCSAGHASIAWQGVHDLRVVREMRAARPYTCFPLRVHRGWMWMTSYGCVTWGHSMSRTTHISRTPELSIRWVIGTAWRACGAFHATAAAIHGNLFWGLSKLMKRNFG